jgi:hypothetical protein
MYSSGVSMHRCRCMRFSLPHIVPCSLHVFDVPCFSAYHETTSSPLDAAATPTSASCPPLPRRLFSRGIHTNNWNCPTHSAGSSSLHLVHNLYLDDCPLHTPSNTRPGPKSLDPVRQALDCMWLPLRRYLVPRSLTVAIYRQSRCSPQAPWLLCHPVRLSVCLARYARHGLYLELSIFIHSSYSRAHADRVVAPTTSTCA